MASRTAGTKTKLGAAALAAALTAFAAFEGTRPDPYQDFVGVWTVCNGHTGLDIDPNKTYSPAECETLLLRDWSAHEADLDRCLPPGFVLSDGERIAYTDLMLNIGPGRAGVRSGVCVQRSGAPSSIMRQLTAGKRQSACAAIGLFVFAGGKDCRLPVNRCSGLPKRRSLERQVCDGTITPQQFAELAGR